MKNCEGVGTKASHFEAGRNKIFSRAKRNGNEVRHHKSKISKPRYYDGQAVNKELGASPEGRALSLGTGSSATSLVILAGSVLSAMRS